MRRILTVFILLALSVRAQAATTTAGTTVATPGTTVRGNVEVNNQPNAQPPKNEQPNAPRDVNNGNFVNEPQSGFVNSNYPPRRPFGYSTNQNYPMATNMPQYGSTNRFNQTVAGTNAFGATANNRANGTNSTTYSASITNTLSTMSQTQANNVVQFQTGLTALQQIAVGFGRTQNFQQAIAQNPQARVQLQTVESQINSLAQGSVKPSNDTVQRLTMDLLRADAHAQMTSNQQLVLATVINQMANSEAMTAFQIENAINAAQANLEGAGAPRWVSFSVGADLRAMALELQPNLQLQ